MNVERFGDRGWLRLMDDVGDIWSGDEDRYVAREDPEPRGALRTRDPGVIGAEDVAGSAFARIRATARRVQRRDEPARAQNDQLPVAVDEEARNDHDDQRSDDAAQVAAEESQQESQQSLQIISVTVPSREGSLEDDPFEDPDYEEPLKKKQRNV